MFTAIQTGKRALLLGATLLGAVLVAAPVSQAHAAPAPIIGASGGFRYIDVTGAHFTPHLTFTMRFSDVPPTVWTWYVTDRTDAAGQFHLRWYMPPGHCTTKLVEVRATDYVTGKTALALARARC